MAQTLQDDGGALQPRERILQAATMVFSRSGFSAGSLKEVASLAGYTNAGLLHYYPSKQAILLALLQSRDAQLGLGAEPADPEMTFLELLENLPAEYERIAEDRQLMQLWHQLLAEASDPEHPAHEWVKEREARVRETVMTTIERSLALGELPADTSPADLAATLQAVVEGLEGQWLVDERVSIQRGMRLFAGLFTTGHG